MDIFKKPYTVRRFGEQQFVKGHATAGYEDETTKLNVQPLNPDELQSLPEGERTVKRVKAFGRFPLRAADQEAGTPGDWLWYLGQWFECISSVPWDHTMLAHFRSEFVAVPEQKSSTAKPPEGGVAP